MLFYLYPRLTIERGEIAGQMPYNALHCSDYCDKLFLILILIYAMAFLVPFSDALPPLKVYCT